MREALPFCLYCLLRRATWPIGAAGPKAEAITSKAGRAGRRLSVRLEPFGLHDLHDSWIAQVLEQHPGGLRLPGVRADARGEVDVGLYGGRERADVVQLRVGARRPRP